MSEFDDLFSDEFFIIGSSDLDSVSTRFYGYTIVEDKGKHKVVK